MQIEPSDAALDQARSVGDLVLDPIVASVALYGSDGVGATLGRLFAAPDPPLDNRLFADCWRALSAACETESPQSDHGADAGQSLFHLYGPEILLTLGSYALPLTYAAGSGVQVVYRTRRMKNDPIRRLCDTAQMVTNAMTSDVSHRGSVAWQTTAKVRVIHALVRRFVGSDPSQPWDRSLGVPINQEDLCGTLLAFSVAVLDGLRRMGAAVSRDDGDAYVRVWARVAAVLGIDRALIPRTEEEGVALAYRIGMRQVRKTDEGCTLMADLLPSVDSLFRPFRGYAVSLTDFFLAKSVFGDRIRDAIGLPPPNWTRFVLRARAFQKRLVLKALPWVPGARRRRSWLARRFLQSLILLKHPDGRMPFQAPPSLLAVWRCKGRRDGARSA